MPLWCSFQKILLQVWKPCEGLWYNPVSTGNCAISEHLMYVGHNYKIRWTQRMVFPRWQGRVTIGRSLFMWKERESQKLTQIQGLWYCPEGQVSRSWYMYLLDYHNREAKVSRIVYVHLSILESIGHISDTWMYVWMMSKFTHYSRNFTWFPLNSAERNALFMVNSAFVAWRYYFC